MSKHQSYEYWSTHPMVIGILSNVIKSSKKSFFRSTEDGRDVVAPIKKELVAMGVPGAMATRLMQEFPFGEGEFRYNRKRNGKYLSGEEMTARQERKALRVAEPARKLPLFRRRRNRMRRTRRSGKPWSRRKGRLAGASR